MRASSRCCCAVSMRRWQAAGRRSCWRARCCRARRHRPDSIPPTGWRPGRRRWPPSVRPAMRTGWSAALRSIATPSPCTPWPGIWRWLPVIRSLCARWQPPPTASPRCRFGDCWMPCARRSWGMISARRKCLIACARTMPLRRSISASPSALHRPPAAVGERPIRNGRKLRLSPPGGSVCRLRQDLKCRTVFWAGQRQRKRRGWCGFRASRWPGAPHWRRRLPPPAP